MWSHWLAGSLPGGAQNDPAALETGSLCLYIFTLLPRYDPVILSLSIYLQGWSKRRLMFNQNWYVNIYSGFVPNSFKQLRSPSVGEWQPTLALSQDSRWLNRNAYYVGPEKWLVAKSTWCSRKDLGLVPRTCIRQLTVTPVPGHRHRPITSQRDTHRGINLKSKLISIFKTKSVLLKNQRKCPICTPPPSTGQQLSESSGNPQDRGCSLVQFRHMGP